MRDKKMLQPKRSLASIAVATALAGGIHSAQAQEQEQSATSLLLEEVVVTARKREESIMDVPIAVTALSSDQLNILKVRDIQSLSVGLPNVATFGLY